MGGVTIRAAAFFLVTGICAAPAAVADPPDLGGIWQINRELSEDPLAKLRAGRARGGRRADPGAIRMPDVSRLVIRHREPELTISFPDGSQRLFVTDGRQLALEMEHGYIEASARWKGAKLVYTGERVEGAKVTVEWELIEDGRRLQVLTKLYGGPGGSRLSYRRIYDRQPLVTGEPDPASDGVEADDTPKPDPPEPNGGDKR